MVVLLAVLGTWAAAGLIVAWSLSRHGHNFWLLGFMGLGYGPFLALIWLRAARGQPTGTRFVRSEPSRFPDAVDGWIDVLVGLDGSDASVESAQRALAMLGPSPRRLCLASVLDHEVFNAPDGFEVDERRIAHLEDAAKRLGSPEAELVLISGRPDKALRDHASAEGFDLLIVAHHRGIGSAIRGSTSGRLARSAEIPILIGPPVA